MHRPARPAAHSHPMIDAVIDEIDGRAIRDRRPWLADFASCNYLGFDLDPEVIDAVPEYLRRWGTHPSWSRLLGSPMLYEEIEEQSPNCSGCEDALVLPTITHIHMSVIPVLAGGGTIFLDGRAHKTIYDGARSPRRTGATIDGSATTTPTTSRSCCGGTGRRPGLIARRRELDDRQRPRSRRFAALAAEHDALLYVDDAHGFGVIGERSRRRAVAYGTSGNSVVRHLGETYDNVVLVGGFSKSYSSLLAFLACPTRAQDALKVAAPPYLYSGPSPVASLATALAGPRGQRARGGDLHAPTLRARRTGPRRARAPRDRHAEPRPGCPIIEIPLADHEDIDEVGRSCSTAASTSRWRPTRSCRSDEVGFRIQITAANSDDEIDHLCDPARQGSGSSSPGRRGRRPGTSWSRMTARAITRRAWLVYLAAAAVAPGVRRRPAELRSGRST